METPREKLQGAKHEPFSASFEQNLFSSSSFAKKSQFIQTPSTITPKSTG
jgi:hypothetical protein